MKVPVKILLAKNWLTGGEANSLLDHLCACSVPAEYFIEVVGAQEVDAYITSEEARRSQHGGWIADTGADLVVETLRGGEITIPDDQMAKAITGQLFVRERGPEYGLTGHDYSVYLDGSIFECKGSSGTLERWIWRGETPGINSMASAAIYFKPSDIQALANTINGTEQPATDAGEAEQLRQRIAELEAENATMKTEQAGIGARQQGSIGRLLYVLCRMAKIGPEQISKPHAAASDIKTYADLEGLQVLGTETIAAYLKWMPKNQSDSN